MHNDYTELVLVLFLIASVCNLALNVLKLVCAIGGM